MVANGKVSTVSRKIKALWNAHWRLVKSLNCLSWFEVGNSRTHSLSPNESLIKKRKKIMKSKQIEKYNLVFTNLQAFSV